MMLPLSATFIWPTSVCIMRIRHRLGWFGWHTSLSMLDFGFCFLVLILYSDRQPNNHWRHCDVFIMSLYLVFFMKKQARRRRWHTWYMYDASLLSAQPKTISISYTHRRGRAVHAALLGWPKYTLNLPEECYLVGVLPCGWQTIEGTAFVPWLCRGKLLRFLSMQIVQVIMGRWSESWIFASGLCVWSSCAEENAVYNMMGVARLMDGTTPLQSLEFWYEGNAVVRKQFLADLVGTVTKCRRFMNCRWVVNVVMWVGVSKEVPRRCCCQ